MVIGLTKYVNTRRGVVVGEWEWFLWLADLNTEFQACWISFGLFYFILIMVLIINTHK